VLGIVVLYHPFPDVRKNILSYLYGLDKLILWKNSPDCDDVLPKEGVDYADKIVEMDAGSNVGLAKPYNAAIAYARKHGYTHLLTMDQDSFFEEGDFRKYLNTILEDGEMAIFTPNLFIRGKKKFPVQEGLVEVDTLYNSGTLYPVSVFDVMGVFCEDFFMYAIDTDIALRAEKNSIPKKGVCSVLMTHEEGYRTRKRKFLWKTVTPNEYSPIQSYYFVRDILVLQTIHSHEKIGWYWYFQRWICKRILWILLYEDNKWAKLKGVFTGYIHGITRVCKHYPEVKQ
jgi:rhamnosyltransferase